MSTPETETTEMQSLKLGDQFDTALLGATIRGQFAYSLTRLTELAMQLPPPSGSDARMNREEAQHFVAAQVLHVTRQHGDAAPVFIDDYLIAGAELPPLSPEGKRIAIPGHTVPTGEIAIPGQNHGAVKGFLDPNGVRV